MFKNTFTHELWAVIIQKQVRLVDFGMSEWKTFSTHNTLEPPVQALKIILDNTRAGELREKIEDTTGRTVVTDMFDG